jgi:hypothetical protein
MNQIKSNQIKSNQISDQTGHINIGSVGYHVKKSFEFVCGVERRRGRQWTDFFVATLAHTHTLPQLSFLNSQRTRIWCF